MYADDYVDNGVLNADPVELICMLYAKAVQKLHLAIECLGNDDIGGRASTIAHSMEVILELQGSLDLEQGGDLAENLAELYAYCQKRLGEADAEQRVEPIEEVVQLLSILQEGWHECRPGSTLEELPLGIAAEAGRGMSLTPISFTGLSKFADDFQTILSLSSRFAWISGLFLAIFKNTYKIIIILHVHIIIF